MKYFLVRGIVFKHVLVDEIQREASYKGCEVLFASFNKGELIDIEFELDELLGLRVEETQ